jgi:histidine triad (HIT) family protein
VTDCLFCRIVSGEADAVRVHEDERTLSFLDIRPLFAGHVLLVPRDHHETLADLPCDLVGPLFEAAQRLARAVQEAMDARGTFVAMNNTVSQSVPHVHVHVVPRRPKDGLRGLFWPRTRYTDAAEMQAVATRISGRLS